MLTGFRNWSAASRLRSRAGLAANSTLSHWLSHALSGRSLSLQQLGLSGVGGVDGGPSLPVAEAHLLDDILA